MMHTETRIPRLTTLPHRRWWRGVALLAMPALLAAHSAERHDELVVEGFAEPYRTVEVAAVDVGIVETIHVVEGESVQAGQLLVTLDQELYQVQLAIAREAAAAVGRLGSAQSELELRRQRASKLEQLSARGFARAEEVERARADVRLGESELLTVREELQIRRLEFERAQIQLERRHIRSKLAGVVTKIHKEAGEFVAGNDPVVVTVVQLDPLRMSFSVPRNQALRLEKRPTLPVHFVATDTEALARVEYVSPLTDAESNTVSVRLTIDNPAGRFRAGDRCELDLRALDPGLAASAASAGPRSSVDVEHLPRRPQSTGRGEK